MKSYKMASKSHETIPLKVLFKIIFQGFDLPPRFLRLSCCQKEGTQAYMDKKLITFSVGKLWLGF
jgi:hypothetical protein